MQRNRGGMASFVLVVASSAGIAAVVMGACGKKGASGPPAGPDGTAQLVVDVAVTSSADVVAEAEIVEPSELEQAVAGILGEFRSGDAERRRAGLLAMQWLPPGALGGLGAAELDPFLECSADGEDNVRAVAVLAEHGLWTSADTLQRLLMLTEAGCPSTVPEASSQADIGTDASSVDAGPDGGNEAGGGRGGTSRRAEPSDGQLARALARNCSMARDPIWQRLRDGGSATNVYLEVVRRCGATTEQSTWFVGELASRLDRAAGASTGRGGSRQARAEGFRAMLDARQFLAAAPGLEPATVVPLLLGKCSDRQIGAEALTILIALAARSPDATLAAIGPDTTWCGLLLRTALGDETAKPDLTRELERADVGKLALAVRLSGDAALVDRLGAKFCRETNIAAAVDMGTAILTAYAANPGLTEKSTFHCGEARADKPDDVATSTTDLADLLAKLGSGRLPAADYERLPRLALALARNGRLDEAMAILAYLDALAGEMGESYYQTIKGLAWAENFPAMNRVLGVSSFLPDLAAVGSLEALWRLKLGAAPANIAFRSGIASDSPGPPEAAELGSLGLGTSAGLGGSPFVAAVADSIAGEADRLFVASRPGFTSLLGYLNDTTAIDLIAARIDKLGFDREAVLGLARLLPPGDAKFGELVQNASAPVRRAAALAMGLQRSPAALPTLRNMLASEETADRTAAQVALVWILSTAGPDGDPAPGAVTPSSRPVP